MNGAWSFVSPQIKPVAGGPYHPSVRYSACSVAYDGQLVVTHGYHYNHDGETASPNSVHCSQQPDAPMRAARPQRSTRRGSRTHGASAWAPTSGARCTRVRTRARRARGTRARACCGTTRSGCTAATTAGTSTR
eukprot:4845431-Prymnesium_polylepis.1